MSDFHETVTCEKCGHNDLKLIAPLRLNFQNHSKCQSCGHEELEILTFMRWDIAQSKEQNNVG